MLVDESLLDDWLVFTDFDFLNIGLHLWSLAADDSLLTSGLSDVDDSLTDVYLFEERSLPFLDLDNVGVYLSSSVTQVGVYMLVVGSNLIGFRGVEGRSPLTFVDDLSSWLDKGRGLDSSILGSGWSSSVEVAASDSSSYNIEIGRAHV